jgi:hypothetical protein
VINSTKPITAITAVLLPFVICLLTLPRIYACHSWEMVLNVKHIGLERNAGEIRGSC